MSNKKMMLVSLIATVCLSILAVVTIMLVSQFQNGGVEKAADTKKTTKVEEPTVIESPETEVADFQAEGIRYYTDDFGTHDVYFEKDTKAASYVGTTGPIDIKVEKLQLERFYPAERLGDIFAEGNDEMTLAAVTLSVHNTSNSEAYFELKTVRGKADNGEVATVETLLSDDFDLTYAPNEARTGTIYFMYKAVPDKIATVTLRFSSAEDANHQSIDKGTDIKVNLY